jgi:hypothetical protein
MRLLESPPPPRHRHSAAVNEEQIQLREVLRQALATRRAIELTLADTERDETIKARYRIAARALGCRLRFQTLQYRPYRDRNGQDGEEAAVLLAVVTLQEVGQPVRALG